MGNQPGAVTDSLGRFLARWPEARRPRAPLRLLARRIGYLADTLPLHLDGRQRADTVHVRLRAYRVPPGCGDVVCTGRPPGT